MRDVIELSPRFDDSQTFPTLSRDRTKLRSHCALNVYYLRPVEDCQWASFYRVVTKTRDYQCPIVPHGWAFRNTK